MSYENSDRIKYWKERWNQGQIAFHQKAVCPMLEKHLDKLIPDGKANKIFFPLCGKAVDMKWLADMGFTIVGVEGMDKAIEAFFTEQGVESVVEDLSKSGSIFKVYKSKDNKIRLYNGDILDFTIDNEGTFDAVYDKSSLVALQRADVQKYAKVIQSLLSPGGRILVEVYEYDISIVKDIEEGPTKPPPPYPMYEDELKNLYEPDCTIEFVDRYPRDFFGKEVHCAIYLIMKTS